MYDYPRAGTNAPILIRMAICVFRLLPLPAKQKTPLLYWLLGSGTPPYKMSKADSQYTDVSPYPDKQTCGSDPQTTCIFAFQNVKNQRFICSQIDGEIKPPGWCRLWQP